LHKNFFNFEALSILNILIYLLSKQMNLRGTGRDKKGLLGRIGTNRVEMGRKTQIPQTPNQKSNVKNNKVKDFQNTTKTPS